VPTIAHHKQRQRRSLDSADGLEAQAVSAACRILLDLGLPGMSGIEGIPPLHELYPDASIAGHGISAEEHAARQTDRRSPRGCQWRFSRVGANRTPRGGVVPPFSAAELGVTTRTISFHVQNVYAKLWVHSKTEAVTRALRENLLA
jgi:DNA-binding NarL/FixJ family response regulator